MRTESKNYTGEVRPDVPSPVSELEDILLPQPEFSETLMTRGAALGVVATGLSACGGGGGGGVTPPAPPPPPPPPPTYLMTQAQAAHFLLRAQFSASPADIEALRVQGHKVWLDRQFASAIGQSGRQWLDSQTHGTPKADGNYFLPFMGDWMIWRQLMTRPDQMRMRCAFALSEMMVASLNPIDGFWPPYVIAGYWDMLNANVFGNFRTLIEEVTLNPAMGFYLNTKGNVKEDPATGQMPDENYAREIMQLFTIGLHQLNPDGTEKTDGKGNPIETYGQSDITNLARVFTGYDWNYSRVTWQNTTYLPYPIPTTQFTYDRMSVDPSKHSQLEIRFLGTRIPPNTPAADSLRIALDTLFNHPNTGPFFAKQMIKRLVTSNPTPAYVKRVADAFANNGAGVRGDLKAVWRAILTDPEALTPFTGPTEGKVREPIVRYVQWARTFNVSSTNGKWEHYDTQGGSWGLGQSPLRSPSVFNFYRPGYVPPQTAIARQELVAPEFQIHNETTTAGYINFMSVTIDKGYNDVKPNYGHVVGMVHDVGRWINWLNLHLTANQLSAATLSAIRNALESKTVTAASSDADKRERAMAGILLVMSSPEYIVQK